MDALQHQSARIVELNTIATQIFAEDAVIAINHRYQQSHQKGESLCISPDQQSNDHQAYDEATKAIKDAIKGMNNTLNKALEDD